jgi:hypothetical protein
MKMDAGGYAGRLRQIAIPQSQLEAGIYGPTNTLVPWGAIATLRPRAVDIAAQIKLHFDLSFDDVDQLQVALLELTPSTRIALVDHLRAPVPATEVHANVDDAVTARQLLMAILAHLQLGEDAVTWWRYQD